MDRIKAASFAYTSTAFPMLTGTIVTAAGFIPIGFARSDAGEYSGSLFWVLAAALASSWLVAILFSPLIGVYSPAEDAEEARSPRRGAFDPVVSQNHVVLHGPPLCW